MTGTVINRMVLFTTVVESDDNVLIMVALVSVIRKQCKEKNASL